MAGRKQRQTEPEAEGLPEGARAAVPEGYNEVAVENYVGDYPDRPLEQARAEFEEQQGQ